MPILLVSACADDHASLLDILAHPNWQLNQSAGCRSALEFLDARKIPVLICERDQADGNWRDLLFSTRKLPSPPSVIVFSRLADERLWSEVINLCGYDVLIKPFDRDEVSRVTFGAWQAWKRERGGASGRIVSKSVNAAAGQAARYSGAA